MPRFEVGEGDGGLVVEGIYRGMLERERVRCGQPDPRRTVADPQNPDSGFYRHPRRLLDALEAGHAVVVSRRTAEMGRDFRFRLPWERAVRSVRVSPDDVVRPTDEKHPSHGCT